MQGMHVYTALQYFGYLLEVALLIFLLFRLRSRRVLALVLYVSLLFLVDSVARPYVLYAYGMASQEYRYFFWLSDVALALAAFLLVCCFFRRACAGEAKMWRFLRLLLFFVFLLVGGISALSLSHNYSHIWSMFIIEFEQNLYFTCLVLNTLLYILLQQLQSADGELELLVCGMGVLFAGPAASLALAHLTMVSDYSKSLLQLIYPLCNAGTLLIWFYAVARMTKGAVVAQAGLGEAPEARLPDGQAAAERALG